MSKSDLDLLHVYTSQNPPRLRVDMSDITAGESMKTCTLDPDVLGLFEPVDTSAAPSESPITWIEIEGRAKPSNPKWFVPASAATMSFMHKMTAIDKSIALIKDESKQSSASAIYAEVASRYSKWAKAVIDRISAQSEHLSSRKQNPAKQDAMRLAHLSAVTFMADSVLTTLLRTRKGLAVSEEEVTYWDNYLHEQGKKLEALQDITRAMPERPSSGEPTDVSSASRPKTSQITKEVKWWDSSTTRAVSESLAFVQPQSETDTALPASEVTSATASASRISSVPGLIKLNARQRRILSKDEQLASRMQSTYDAEARMDARDTKTAADGSGLFSLAERGEPSEGAIPGGEKRKRRWY